MPWLRRTLIRLSLAIGAAGTILFVSLSAAPDPRDPHAASENVQSAAAAPVWLIDIDGDGAADLANPTQNRIRGIDLWGSGSFLAGRDHDKRKHMGADFIAASGDAVHAPMSGIITSIGSAYGNDPYLRFIELSNKEEKFKVRIFYVQPGVAIGKEVKAGDVIGAAQSLDRRYPLITNHVHVEIRDGRGRFINPAIALPPAHPTSFTFAAYEPPPRAHRAAPKRVRTLRSAQAARRARGAIPAAHFEAAPPAVAAALPPAPTTAQPAAAPAAPAAPQVAPAPAAAAAGANIGA